METFMQAGRLFSRYKRSRIERIRYRRSVSTQAMTVEIKGSKPHAIFFSLKKSSSAICLNLS